MSRNRRNVVKYLVRNQPKLNHLGTVTKLSVPNKDDIIVINSEADVDKFVRTKSPIKNADIYINNVGVVVKQIGHSLPYNKLERANIVDIFGLDEFKKPEEILIRLDELVDKFHKKIIVGRARDWRECFDVDEYRYLLEFLMMKGNQYHGLSSHQADFILEVPSYLTSDEQLRMFTFDEYFDEHIDAQKVSVRRAWYGQASKIEHDRANTFMGKAGNIKWVYDEVSGEPNYNSRTRTRWQDKVAERDRKTVYYLMMEKCTQVKESIAST